MEITKPPVIPSWAEAGDKVQPSNAEIQVGWPLSSIPPSRQRFNWILNFVSNAVRYLLQRGLPEWSASEDYPIGSRVQYAGSNYVSLTANTNKQPDTNTSDWEQWGYGDTAFQGRVDQLASFYVTNADVALTAAQAKAGILNVSGTLTGNRNIIIPNSPRRFVIINGTSGDYSLGVKTASGSAVTVAQGGATSVVCDGANNVKLASTNLSSYAPINSPALTGNPTAPTPAQFDNDTSIATTAFVRQAIGNASGYRALVTGTTALSAADAGKVVMFAQSGAIATLPAGSSLAAGTVFLFCNGTSNGNGTVQRNGTDQIYVADTAVTSISVNGGETLGLVWTGTTWFAFSGSSGLYKASSSFGSFLAANGYQKLPSGLIIQWGRKIISDPNVDYFGSISFPIAFPNSTFLVNVALYSYAGSAFDASAAVTVQALHGFDFTVQEWTGINQSIEVVYIAIGY